MCRFHVCALPVVLRCVFVSEQLQIDGLRSSLHAPVLREKKHFNPYIISRWCLEKKVSKASKIVKYNLVQLLNLNNVTQ